MSALYTPTPQVEAMRQQSRRDIIRHYCKLLHLEAEIECRHRYGAAFDDLTPTQVDEWLKKLANIRARQLGNL